LDNPLTAASVEIHIPQFVERGVDISYGPWSGGTVEDLPPWPDSPKASRLPKLDSRLDGLFNAELRGEAESFARRGSIDLVDGSVRVAIGAAPGQLDAAVKAVERFGTVEVIAERSEGIQALIPITSLIALIEEESIRSIRMPIKGTTG